MRDNFIEGLDDQVIPLLNTMMRLQSLDLRDNKVQLEARYREHMIMEGRSLKELDGKTIRDQIIEITSCIMTRMTNKIRCFLILVRLLFLPSRSAF